MTGIVETQKERVTDIKDVSPDKAVGICVLHCDFPSEAQGPFDVRRLRRALLAYEEVCGEQEVYIDVKDRTDGYGKVLVLQPRSSALRTIGLASLTTGDEGGDGA